MKAHIECIFLLQVQQTIKLFALLFLQHIKQFSNITYSSSGA